MQKLFLSRCKEASVLSNLQIGLYYFTWKAQLQPGWSSFAIGTLTGARSRKANVLLLFPQTYLQRPLLELPSRLQLTLLLPVSLGEHNPHQLGITALTSLSIILRIRTAGAECPPTALQSSKLFLYFIKTYLNSPRRQGGTDTIVSLDKQTLAGKGELTSLGSPIKAEAPLL